MSHINPYWEGSMAIPAINPAAFSDLSDLDRRIFSREECEKVIERVKGFASREGKIRVQVESEWNGELRWARNRVSLAGDRRDIWVSIHREIAMMNSTIHTNQIDDVSLESAVRASERPKLLMGTRQPYDVDIATPALSLPSPKIWSDTTFNVTASDRGALARQLTVGSENANMLSAGFLSMYGKSFASSGPMGWVAGAEPPGMDMTPPGMERAGFLYYQRTIGQCSMTVRHPKGIGSGWAGLSGYDWAQIDGTLLAQRALEKCLTSIDPVRIEPGRYTVILEPQAVYDMVSRLVLKFGRPENEGGQRAFTLSRDVALELWRTKLGLKIIDERVTIDHDPDDPRLGVPPQSGLRPITWVDHGILKTMSYERERYALAQLNSGLPELDRRGFRMSGGTTTIEDMIASTKRGVLVTRFSNLAELDGGSVLHTGVTRDGLWLVEGGKISKAVKNMRMTESPIFVLNQIEQMGVPVPVFCPAGVALVPPLKSNDFSFTSLVDAV